MILANAAVIISGFAVFLVYRKRLQKKSKSGTTKPAVVPFEYDLSDTPSCQLPSTNDTPVVVKLKGRNWWNVHMIEICGSAAASILVCTIVVLSFVASRDHIEGVNKVEKEKNGRLHKEDSINNAEKALLFQQTTKLCNDIDTVKNNTKYISTKVGNNKRKEKK